MANPQISAQEQLLMELINRARLDPSGEAARYGISLNKDLSSGTISTASKAPLAWNTDLRESAALHSEWMLQADTFSHTGAGGSSSRERMAKAGYDFTGSWSSGENIAWRGTTESVDKTASIYSQHKDLFLSAGHRKTMMGDHREVGLAQEFGGFDTQGRTWNSSMITENFAKTGTKAFITGVAHSDRDGDKFYDVGEGKGGIVVDWLGNSGGAKTTQSAGGYGVSIPTGLKGTTNVAVTVDGDKMVASLGMTGTNVKLDVINGRILAASTHLTLGDNAEDGRLLGIGNLKLTGNSDGNRLEGNGRGNKIWGMDGDDTILGRGGNDRIEGGRGNDRLTGGGGSDTFVFKDVSGSNTGKDVITDLGRGDRIVIDLQGTLPNESAWEDRHISASSGGWLISLDDGSRIQVNGVSLGTLENALTLI